MAEICRASCTRLAALHLAPRPAPVPLAKLRRALGTHLAALLLAPPPAPVPDAALRRASCIRLAASLLAALLLAPRHVLLALVVGG